MYVAVYFISGHLDLTDEEFALHYKPRIDAAFAGDWLAHFAVGDARGADTMAQAYLASLRDPMSLIDAAQRPVTVFHMFDKPRNLVSPAFLTKGGFKTDDERDAAMTAFTHKDIAWVRPGRERSGTARNLARRAAR